MENHGRSGQDHDERTIGYTADGGYHPGGNRSPYGYDDDDRGYDRWREPRDGSEPRYGASRQGRE